MLVPGRRARLRGMTLVELMIAIAIGLFVSAVTIKVVVDRLDDDRIHIAEVRVNQNLRAAADVIARELRRASYWEASLSGVWTGGSAPAVNPYAAVVWPALTELDYAYQRDATIAARQFQFRRAEVGGVGVLQFRDAARADSPWQDLTDPSAVNILNETGTGGKRFAIRVLGPATEPAPHASQSVPGREVELFHFCQCRTQLPLPANCTDAALGVSSTRPRLVIRQFEIRIPGRSVVEPQVERELVETVRVRNDALVGSCPVSP